MQNLELKKFTAEAVVSEIQSSDIYLTIKARLFDLQANLNGVRVTRDFMDEIIANESKYVGIPLYADIHGLIAKRPIGHMYNPRTGEFLSTQIGSFCHYEEEITEENVCLIGYARVMKRNKIVCKAIEDLYQDGNLKFSFELSCGSYSTDKNGVIVIDVHPSNYFEGEAIVTFPACQEAVALQLVAECLNKGDDNMTTEENTTVEMTDEEKHQAEEKKPEDVEIKEETVEVLNKEQPDEVPEKAKDEEKEVHAETQDDVSNEEDKTSDVKSTAENEPALESPQATKIPEEVKPDIGELMEKMQKMSEVIAELTETVAKLGASAECQKNLENSNDVGIHMNPFMGSITTPSKYTLLQKETKNKKNHTLFERE